ncbi:DUF1702 family protein [Actinosynnema sp. NPDC059335]|uniref:DUF1702 family protein n=1 Tax=Actinosynnema sp. NPDC059335 TaxID=3346804 RepID=UPI00366F9FEF
MSSLWGALRRRVLTPDISATKLSVRGFHYKDDTARELLETVGRSFLQGYGHAAESRTPDEAERNLELLPHDFRGFAYEGAGMGFAVRDALPFGRGGRVGRFLEGRAKAHDYMVIVGVGWAMARVPRSRWSKLGLDDPLLRWLALDGYGFHQAYFHTGKYVRQQYREADFPWPADGHAWYSARGIDQGIGRALWFVGGADPKVVVDLVESFDEERHADLYAGTGLAATYAGGLPEDELRWYADRVGRYLPNVAQGSAFAATARVDQGLVVRHTGAATRVFCDLTPDEAARLCHDTRPPAVAELPEHPGIPAFEVWRRRITAAFTTEADVTA